MKIGIIGGGAAGMMAAVTAARENGEVTILEKKDRIGKKILVTGNGKCNFTNRNVGETDYLSEREGIYRDYVTRFNEQQVLDFFAQQGMLARERNGYLYPRSEQASTILDIFRNQLQEMGVTVLTNSCPKKIEAVQNGFLVKLARENLFFHRLILACGSFAGEKQQEGVSGYHYAKQFGHTIVPVVPALVQLRAKDDGDVFKTIAGVRCEASITLYIDGNIAAKERGELQLTDYGISGIPVFQLSRHAAYGFWQNKRVRVSLDFLPEYDREEWKQLVSSKWEHFPKTRMAEEFFLGFLHKKLNLLFMKQTGIKPQTELENFTLKQILAACLAMKDWQVELTQTNPFAMAQICAGGVSMKEVDLQLQSKKIRGLYFAGEMLDVDGRCGGYNLQWAWTSGYIAGKAVSQKTKNRQKS